MSYLSANEYSVLLVDEGQEETSRQGGQRDVPFARFRIARAERSADDRGE